MNFSSYSDKNPVGILKEARNIECLAVVCFFQLEFLLNSDGIIFSAPFLPELKRFDQMASSVEQCPSRIPEEEFHGYVLLSAGKIYI